MDFINSMQLYYLLKASKLSEKEIAYQLMEIQRKEALNYFNSDVKLSDLEKNIAKLLGKELVKTITVPFKL